MGTEDSECLNPVNTGNSPSAKHFLSITLFKNNKNEKPGGNWSLEVSKAMNLVTLSFTAVLLVIAKYCRGNTIMPS